MLQHGQDTDPWTRPPAAQRRAHRRVRPADRRPGGGATGRCLRRSHLDLAERDRGVADLGPSWTRLVAGASRPIARLISNQDDDLEVIVMAKRLSMPARAMRRSAQPFVRRSVRPSGPRRWTNPRARPQLSAAGSSRRISSTFPPLTRSSMLGRSDRGFARRSPKSSTPRPSGQPNSDRTTGGRWRPARGRRSWSISKMKRSWRGRRSSSGLAG